MAGEHFSTPLVASIVQQLVGANTRAIRCDAQGRLEVVAAAGAPMDVNIIQVAGTAVEEGGIAGALGVGGLAAHDAAAEGDPVQVGGVYVQNPGDVDDGDAARILTDIKGRPAIDLQMLNSQALTTPGINGCLAVGGDVADDAAESLLYPLKLGAVASQNPLADSVDDGDMAKLITDLERYVRTRGREYNPLTDAAKVENQNLISDDYDAAAQQLADVTDQAAARTNYPSDAGFEIGSRDLFGIIVGVRDGEFDIEVSNDGTNWVIATRTLVDVTQGSNGFTAAGHYTEPDAATVYFGITWSDRCEFRYIRLAFTPPNATNVFNASARFRAH